MKLLVLIKKQQQKKSEKHIKKRVLKANIDILTEEEIRKKYFCFKLIYNIFNFNLNHNCSLNCCKKLMIS